MTDKARTRLEARWDQARSQVKEMWGRLDDVDVEDRGPSWSRLVRRLRRRESDAVRAIEPAIDPHEFRIEGDPTHERR